MQCPHTFNPSPHNIKGNIDQNMFQCKECHGHVRHCPSGGCGLLNRLEAKYCTSCGDVLPSLDEEHCQLKKLGMITATVNKDLEKYSLKSCLGLNDLADEMPLLWQGLPSGVVVFTYNPLSSNSSLSLFFVPEYNFRPRQALLLCNDVPPYTEWRQKPVITEQGIFINARGTLHYFPSHGGSELYEHRKWHPKSSEKLLFITENKHGVPSLLVKIKEDRLAIYEGSPQSGQWGNLAENIHYIDSLSASHRPVIFLDDTDEENPSYKIYDGNVLIHYDPEIRKCEDPIDVGGSTDNPETYPKALRRKWFTPFVTYTESGDSICVLPVDKGEGDTYGVGLLQANNTILKQLPLKNISNHDWIVEDRSRRFFIVGDTQGNVQAYSGHTELSFSRSSKGQEDGSQLFIGDNWAVAQITKQAGQLGQSSTNKKSTVLWFATYQQNDDGRVKQLVSKSTNLIDGLIGKKGLSPLYYNKKLYTCMTSTNDLSNDHVYLISVAD